MTDLETKIFNYIECLYDATFLGKVIIEIDADTYSLALRLNNWMIPLYICRQINKDILIEDYELEFYQYIQEELKERKLDKTKYFRLKLDRDDPGLDEQK